MKFCIKNSVAVQICMLALTLSAVVSAAEGPPGFLHNVEIHMNTDTTGANIAGDVTEFPIVVKLNSSNFPGFADTKDGGADIRFTKQDGTPLTYGIERWIDLS